MKRSIYLLLILMGCSSQAPEILVSVKLANGNHSIHISGFDKKIIDDIGRDTTAGVWQILLPVYKMPADTDMKDFQQPQPGKYVVKDDIVFFTPDTTFQKGQTYFLRYFDYQGVKNAWQTLGEQKRLGSAKHHDLPFSY